MERESRVEDHKWAIVGGCSCRRIEVDSLSSRFYRSEYDLILNSSPTYSTKAKEEDNGTRRTKI